MFVPIYTLKLLSVNQNNQTDIQNARAARNRTNKIIQAAKTEYIKDTLYQNRNDPKKFWRVLNSTLLKGDSISSDITFNLGNDSYTSISNSCYYINEYFANIGKNLHSQFQMTQMDNNNNYTNVYNLENSAEDIIFTVEDIIMVVKSIDVHKGSGIEYLPSFILKDVFEILTDQLVFLFNKSVQTGIFPDSWATATITPIPKNGNKHCMNNWRPISIIPLIGKLLEKLCNSVLIDHLEMHDILCDEQNGFRRDRSTSTSIFNFVKNITESMNSKKLVGCMYLDFSKAFDSINHNRLLVKLKDMGVPKKLLDWITSYLSNRKIKTKLNNSISETSELVCGVPQGSVLGPTLFLCYINDLGMIIKNLGLSINLYADDAVVYHSSADPTVIEDNLKTSLTSVMHWCVKNYININIEKTKFCIYGTRANITRYTSEMVVSDNRHIQRCRSYLYLGVTLDECLTMKPNFNNVFKKFSYKIHQFGKIKKYLNVDTRLLVYKQTVLPLSEYVSFMMYLNTKHDVDKLQRLQNRALRMIYDIQNPRDISIDELHLQK